MIYSKNTRYINMRLFCFLASILFLGICNGGERYAKYSEFSLIGARAYTIGESSVFSIGRNNDGYYSVFWNGELIDAKGCESHAEYYCVISSSEEFFFSYPKKSDVEKWEIGNRRFVKMPRSQDIVIFGRSYKANVIASYFGDDLDTAFFVSNDELIGFELKKGKRLGDAGDVYITKNKHGWRLSD